MYCKLRIQYPVCMWFIFVSCHCPTYSTYHTRSVAFISVLSRWPFSVHNNYLFLILSEVSLAVDTHHLWASSSLA